MRLAVLFALFFGSGACGLLYQVLWLRLLSLVFGVTVYAASTVLAAFMAGLAIGSFLAGRTTRLARPLVVFALAEMLIGLSALASPAVLDAATALYERLYRLSPDSLVVLTIARFVSGVLVLIVPTMLMGLTLPVLSASSVVRGSRFGARVSALYAINTAGAVVGAVVTGFYLIGAVGIARSFQIGAIVNVAIGLAALWLDRQTRQAGAADAMIVGGSTAMTVSTVRRRIGVVVAVSGLVALALEILWFRMLVQYLAATTYAFTTMLATVLAGIALGSGIGAHILRRSRDWLVWLAAVQVATGFAVLASAIALGSTYAAGWRTGDLQASVFAILPVTMLMGLAFPIALHIAAAPHRGDGPEAVAQRVGSVYSLNVLGAIAGAVVGGFLLLPLLGTRRALITLAGLYGATAFLLVVRHPRRRRLLLAGLAAAAAFVAVARQVPDPFTAAYARRYGQDMREFWRDEGVQTAVSVHASEFRRSLYLDGLHQANDTPEMVRLHRLIGHLPMVLHPRPADVLVVGLGGGATGGAVSQYPDARVQIVELSDGVRKAAGFFAHVNYDVLDQPNVRIRVDDGRNFLALSGERFDVVTADIIQPVHAGAGNLYSREYFTLVRQALRDGGLVLQWIGHRPPTQYKLIMRTFLSVFPGSTLWFEGNLMVGSVAPLRIDEAVFLDRRREPRTAAALDDIGLTSFETLRSWYTGGADEMRRFAGNGPILTDDRPLLEYYRSLPDDQTPLDIAPLRGAWPAIATETPQ